MAVPKAHYIHSRGGKIGGAVDHAPADLDAIVTAIRDSQAKRLIIHFHGGLVSKASGMEIAERLLPHYSVGGYPLFFVWESGALETVRNNLADISKEPIFRELVRKVLEYALGKVGVQDGARSVSGPQVDPLVVKDEVRQWFADPANESVPFAGGRPNAGPGERAAAQAVDENAIQLDLESDPDFLRALQGIAEVPAGVRSATGVGAVAPTPTRMDPDKLAEIAPAEAGQTRGLLSLVKVAMLIAKIVVRTVGRLIDSRDHGLYVTVVEEVLREFYVEAIGKAFLWNQMKKDTRDAFGADPDVHAGTALLARLKAAMENGLSLERIFLVGHSTGGIYISNFLDAVDALGFDPAVKFDVVLLAPANTHRVFDQTVTQRGQRIRWLRMFAMKDEVEREDGLLGDDWKRAFYPSSLLYFVSGLLEEKPDTPLLGMQRFLNLNQLFAAPEFAECDRMRAWLASPADRPIWSLTAGEIPGESSQSRKHGDFDNDAQTLASLRWIVTH
jgi:hypothetical protein